MHLLRNSQPLKSRVKIVSQKTSSELKRVSQLKKLFKEKLKDLSELTNSFPSRRIAFNNLKLQIQGII